MTIVASVKIKNAASDNFAAAFEANTAVGADKAVEAVLSSDEFRHPFVGYDHRIPPT